MFDSNAFGVTPNEYFFAEVHYLSDEHKEMGLKVDTLILCQHIVTDRSNRSNTTKIWTSSDSKAIILSDSIEKYCESSLIYSGTPDGNGFLSKKWEAKAKAFFGKWLSNEEIEGTLKITK